MILLTELPQYTTDPNTKESLNNAHSLTRGEDLPEIEQKKVCFKEENEYENLDDDAMTQTTTTSKDGKINNISWTNKKCVQKESQGRNYDKKLGRYSRLPF